MSRFSLWGALPDRISETTQPWQWVGNLRLQGIDPNLVLFVDLLGSGADFFDVVLDRRLGLVSVMPLGLLDAEAFARTGRTPEVTLQLRFGLADGTTVTQPDTWRVSVLDVDDSPPETVAFAPGGGRVRAGEAGAVIGDLRVTDPDTASGFAFRFLPEDEWMFEVVGGSTLKLRPGVALATEDAPRRAVLVEVSDGTNRSAHMLQFEVQASIPGLPLGARLLSPGERALGVEPKLGGTAVASLVPADLRAINGYGEVVQALRADGESVWFRRPQAIDLLNGTIDMDPRGHALAVWAVYDALLRRKPTDFETMIGVRALESGAELRHVIQHVLNSPEWWAMPHAQSIDAYVRGLYMETVGWVPGQGAVDWHKSRFTFEGAGAVVAADIISWSLAFPQATAVAEAGLWVRHTLAPQLLLMNEALLGQPGYEAYRGAETLLAWTGVFHHAAQLVAAMPAFQARYGGMTNDAYLRAVMQEVTGRAPDPWSFADWFRPLHAGEMSRADVLFGLVRQRVLDELPRRPVPEGHEVPFVVGATVGALLDATFGVASPAAWLGPEANAAVAYVQLASAYQLSGDPRFAAKYGALGNRAFVERLGWDVFDRQLDEGSIVHWTWFLDTGRGTRADVLSGFTMGPIAQELYGGPPSFDLL